MSSDQLVDELSDAYGRWLISPYNFIIGDFKVHLVYQRVEDGMTTTEYVSSSTDMTAIVDELAGKSLEGYVIYCINYTTGDNWMDVCIKRSKDYSTNINSDVLDAFLRFKDN